MAPAPEDHSPRKCPRNEERSLQDAFRLAGRMAEQFERLLDTLAHILKKMEEDNESTPPRRPAPATPVGPAPEVHHLRLDPRGEGRAVAFDGGAWIDLPPRLAALLMILASDEGQSPDGLVAWKSFDTMSAALEKKFHKRFSRPNVRWLLCRLRKVLREAGVDARLIESDRHQGARLRLKKTIA